MAPEPMKCTLQTFGTFSTPTFGGVGEPYNDKSKLDSRAKGATFITNKQRAGQTGDNWNRGRYGRRTDFQLMFDKEPYVDPNTHARKARLKEKEKNLTSNGFKYSSPNARSSGLGGYWGCIGPKFGHEADFDVLKKDDKPPEVPHELKQVLTNPAKKGYGHSTPGIIFGPGPAKGEEPKVGKEYVHSADPYDMARQYEQAERKYNLEKLASRPAFKTVSHSVDFFDAQKRVASSMVFTEDPRIPERPVVKEEKAARVPFYPAKAPKSGPQGTFNKFPLYKEDPLDEKLKAAKAAADAAKAVTGDKAPFKPPMKPKTSPTKSILFHQAGPKP